MILHTYTHNDGIFEKKMFHSFSVENKQEYVKKCNAPGDLHKQNALKLLLKRKLVHLSC